MSREEMKEQIKRDFEELIDRFPSHSETERKKQVLRLFYLQGISTALSVSVIKMGELQELAKITAEEYEAAADFWRAQP